MRLLNAAHRTNYSRASQIRFHLSHVRRVSRADWHEEWGETDKKSEVRQTRRVRWDRQDEWGETDKTSEVRQTRRVRWDRQEEWGETDKKWGETDKKSEVRQTRRVRWDRQDEWGETDKEWGETDKKSEVRHRQEEWGETDKKSEVRQTRRWQKSFKTKCKSACFKNILDLKSLLTSAINLSQWFWTFFPPGRTMVQVHVSRAARMSFTYYVINTNQPDL